MEKSKNDGFLGLMDELLLFGAYQDTIPYFSPHEELWNNERRL